MISEDHTICWVFWSKTKYLYSISVISGSHTSDCRFAESEAYNSM